MNTIGYMHEVRNAEERNELVANAPHLLLEGKTGSGKSRMGFNLLEDSFQNNEGILFFDVKGSDLDILSRFDEMNRIYKLGVDSGGKNTIKVNLFSHITQSEQHIQRFAKALLVGENNYGDHRFWAQSAELILSTSMMLFSSMNKALMHIANITGEKIEFSARITYIEDEKEKEIPFSISATALTFATFYKKYISNRLHFRHYVANIDAIVEQYLKKIKDHIFYPSLAKEDALMLDKYIHDIKHFAKVFSTYRLPAREDFSGTSGSYFSMIMGIPQILFNDASLNATEDTHDVKELMEQGALVIVATNNLQVQALLFNIYAEHFSLRSSTMPSCNKVNFVLDESSSLVNTGTSIDMEHVVTYARQSKLRLIALFQSTGQIYEAFGANKAESILENFTHLRIIDKEKRDPNYFYYTVDDDDTVFRYDPKFSTEQEKYRALKVYQEQNGDFSSLETSALEVVLYNHNLYNATQQVVVMDINTLRSRNVKYIINESQYYGYFMGKWEYQNNEEYQQEEPGMILG